LATLSPWTSKGSGKKSEGFFSRTVQTFPAGRKAPNRAFGKAKEKADIILKCLNIYRKDKQS